MLVTTVPLGRPWRSLSFATVRAAAPVFFTLVLALTARADQLPSRSGRVAPEPPGAAAAPPDKLTPAQREELILRKHEIEERLSDEAQRRADRRKAKRKKRRH
jgi:hypothetical protein